MILRNIVQGEFCPKNISQVNLIIDIAIAEQGYGNETQHSHNALDDCLYARRRQAPRPNTHEQCSSPSVDTHQGIAQSTGEEDIGCTKTSLLGNTSKAPQQGGYCRGTYGGDEEMATQLEHIYPIAHIHIGQQQKSNWDEHQDSPTMGNMEGTLDNSHQQQPPTAEHQDAQPGNIQKLRKPHAKP